MGQHLDSEDYNQYSVIIDVDGNGWSDRFGNSLIHYATPILKMASNHTAFFEHLYAPDVSFTQFSSNLEDLPEKARRIITDVQKHGSQSHAFHLVRAMLATSQMLMDHLGLIEALAYTLLQYQSLNSLERKKEAEGVVGDDSSVKSGGSAVDGGGDAGGVPAADGFEEVAMTCCSLTRVPAEFATAVTTRLLPKAPREATRLDR